MVIADGRLFIWFITYWLAGYHFTPRQRADMLLLLFSCHYDILMLLFIETYITSIRHIIIHCQYEHCLYALYIAAILFITLRFIRHIHAYQYTYLLSHLSRSFTRYTPYATRREYTNIHNITPFSTLHIITFTVYLRHITTTIWHTVILYILHYAVTSHCRREPHCHGVTRLRYHYAAMMRRHYMAGMLVSRAMAVTIASLWFTSHALAATPGPTSYVYATLS